MKDATYMQWRRAVLDAFGRAFVAHHMAGAATKTEGAARSGLDRAAFRRLEREAEQGESLDAIPVDLRQALAAELLGDEGLSLLARPAEPIPQRFVERDPDTDCDEPQDVDQRPKRGRR